ncbi:hypothetical protein MTR67_023377 [Solanum verrucosum]|uniref:Uncharacterized protein n=1 Tax=Solanum verrucosum TaxID=315347 RepID=A0AAF0TRB7_SOLVR|nr:hypothetical protein MTR67_023377 [Solanum verrucosum]
MQKGRFILYAFRQLKVHEKNYPTHDMDQSSDGGLRFEIMEALSL